MEPANLRFGGGASDTLLHPLVGAVMIVAIILILALPRKYIMMPLLLAIFFVPKGQVIVMAGAHFTVARMLFLAGLVRVANARGTGPTGEFDSIDRVFIMWACCYPVVLSLQWMDSRALIKNLGDFLDAMGGYMVIRFAIRDREDVIRAISLFAVIGALMALCMLNEQVTGANIFGRLGGMPDTTIRDGKIRSQGAFAVFITAGTYGATLIPLLVWLCSGAGRRVTGVLGILGATVMTVTCHASTTIAAYGAGILALCLWPVRKQMRLLRWGIVVALAGLHLAMKGPVWSLIEKIDLTGSSSSYHRYMLIDNCLRHISDWWLLGVKNYDSWGFDMWDLSDQYVAYAVTGGLLTVCLFIGIISRSFGRIGSARKAVEGDRKEEWLLWCLGCSIFAHVVAYFGIGYFDQMQFAWFALLAIIRCSTLDPNKLMTDRPPRGAMSEAAFPEEPVLQPFHVG
ncbi:MAG TPA: hypothetical protein VH639_22810 [Bryobacteraceae bacterium]|jgi:hypothetical protein